MIDIIETLGDSSADFHSAISLTYRLDLELYDGLIRRVLNKAGVGNQIVFCDFRTYVEEIKIQRPRYLGRRYSVVPVHQAGAFHPKAYLLLGSTRGRALIGSGNITVGGLVRNAEVFGQFEYNRETDTGPHPVFGELVAFIRQLGERAPLATRRQLERATLTAGWLEIPPVDDGRRLLIGGPGRRPLLQQMLEQMPTKRFDELLVCSSSFDRRLSGLRRLAKTIRRPPVCIVQPERVEIDGGEVKRLGNGVTWRMFHDPYPNEKRKRRDVFAHAKLYVFRHADTETAVFGSSNASEPALMGPNTEFAVVLPSAKRGRIVERLGLQESLRTSASEQLAHREWMEKTYEGDDLPCALIGVLESDSAFQLTLGAGGLPRGARLAVAAAVNEKPLAVLSLHVDNVAIISERFSLSEFLRVGWLVSPKEVAISNPVVITWPEVAHSRRAASLSSRHTQAILGLYDGVVVGTILFELLDTFRDFEVIRVAGARVGPRNRPGSDGPVEQRPPEFFYTDARSDAQIEQRWAGDRLDLDILASLVQPLSADAKPSDDDDEYEFDESALAEEAERRQIDVQKGQATGSERDNVPGVTGEKLERAIRRLERRLGRAADAIERSLEHLDKLGSIPAQAVARQVWMTQIGAFLACRTVNSDDEEEYECLSAPAFAEYVIRISRALVGSRRGGFLNRLPDKLWKTSDGEVVRRGLGFLRTCVVWATAILIAEYQNIGPDDEAWPRHLACAVPELVAARLVAKLEALGIAADEEDLARRFPKITEVTPLRLAEVRKKVQELATRVESAEGEASFLTDMAPFKPASGELVYNEKLGVTVVMDYVAPTYYWLADLSRPGDAPAKYAAHVRPLLVVGGATSKIGCWYANPGAAVGA